MPLFQFSYKILDHWKVHRYSSCPSTCTKTPDELGCMSLGRWHEWGQKQGLGVVDARDANKAYEWLHSWAEPCCNVELIPVLDDASLVKFHEGGFRDGIGYNAQFGGISHEPRPHETIYIVHFKFHTSGSENYRAHAKTFFRQFEPLDGVRIQARYHDLGTASGWMVAAAIDERELYVMFYTLLTMAEVKIRPVLTDRQLYATLENQRSQHYEWLRLNL